MYEEIVHDANGKELKVGMRVRIVGFDPAKHAYRESHGTVSKITDADMDTDDEGRPKPIYPAVIVNFDDNLEGLFYARWDGDIVNDECRSFTCEDVESVQAREWVYCGRERHARPPYAIVYCPHGCVTECKMEPR